MLAVLAACAAVLAGLLAGPAPASHSAPGRAQAAYRPGVVVVGFNPGVPASSRRRLEALAGGAQTRVLGSAARVARARGGQVRRVGVVARVRLRSTRASSVAAALRRLRGRPEVRFAEPDYLMRESAAPNDPSFGLQWGSANTGQTVNGVHGTPGADDRAVAAWDVTTGTRSVVVGVVDSGLEYTHPDLAANVWSNPGGVGGCAAGTHGYNVVSTSCNPMDDETYYGGHGTHVAGIAGAAGNNAKGVAGMNWTTTLLPVKFLDSSGYGSTSQLIAALDWLVKAKQAGVNLRVINDSATFVGTAYSQALSDEIDVLAANDILFVTAAGNTGDDNDDPAKRRYPCGYDRPNEICATASDQLDRKPGWANYGATTVDLAAPGDAIYSTLRGGGYGYVSGGSMAAAQVSGAAALVLAKGYLSAPALRARLLDTVDPLASLSGLVRTGGRLNVCRAVPGCGSSPSPTQVAGPATPGASVDAFAADRKRVNRVSLPVAGAISKLSIYLGPTGTSGQQALRGVIYADNNGVPGKLLGTSAELVYHTSDPQAWYSLPFATPVTAAAGPLWIGVITGGTSNVAAFRWDSVAGSRVYNVNAYGSGPTDPFGSGTADSQLMSINATYEPTAAPPPPPPPPPPPSGDQVVGPTTPGPSVDTFTSNRKRVNRVSLPAAASLSRLSIYLGPTGTSGQQAIRGVVYADNNGVPGKLLGTSAELIYHSIDPQAWYSLPFTAPVAAPAGPLWIGVITGATSKVAAFRWASSAGSRIYNVNQYSNGASDPFGSGTSDSELMSINATYG